MGSPPGFHFTASMLIRVALFYWKSCSYIPCLVLADLWQLPWGSRTHQGSSNWLCSRMLLAKMTHSSGRVCINLLFTYSQFHRSEGGCCLVTELWGAVSFIMIKMWGTCQHDTCRLMQRHCITLLNAYIRAVKFHSAVKLFAVVCFFEEKIMEFVTVVWLRCSTFIFMLFP